jgi:flavorubredoxin
MEATVTEIAPDVFRIAIAPREAGLSFGCFLIRDEQPAMVETGFDKTFGMYEAVRQAVAGLVDPSSLRHIFVPHFEGDECGSINRFFELAPQAEAVATPIAAGVTLSDYLDKPPRVAADGEKFALGKKTLSVIFTPWVHFWESMLVYDETDRVLFTSDLFGQGGPREPITSEDRSAEVVELALTSGVLPSQKHLERALDRIEPLAVDVIACHHGSVLAGDPTRYYKAFRSTQVGDILDAPFYQVRSGRA